MSKLIKPDALADEIVSLMQQYADEVTSDLKKDVDSVARSYCYQGKEKAPVKKSGAGSKYVHEVIKTAGRARLKAKILTEKIVLFMQKVISIH